MSMLEHRGYYGSVEYSHEDHLLHGSIVGIRDVVTYEGGDVRSLEDNFANAVEEYLAFCTAEGKTPDVPYKGTFNVRVTPELHRRAAQYAGETGKKLNAIVTEALEKMLA